MPWVVEKREDRYCVVVSEGPRVGTTVHCYSGADAEERARRLQAALYANVTERSYTLRHLAPDGKDQTYGEEEDRKPA